MEVTLAKPVDRDHRQAKAAAKAMMAFGCYPVDYPVATSYGFPFSNQWPYVYGTATVPHSGTG